MKKCWIFILCLWTSLEFNFAEASLGSSSCSNSQYDDDSYGSSSEEDNSCDSSSDENDSCDKSSPLEEENGYIFTCPRSIKWGACNELQLRRFGNLDAGVLKIQVFYKENYLSTNDSLAFEKSYDIDEGVEESFLELCLKSVGEYVYDGRIVMSGKFGDYTIGGTEKLYFTKSRDFIVFIQTDKPIYKAGQTVFFRILIVDNKLRPIKKATADIVVTDPKGNRLFQWNNVKPKKGIKQFEFPLANEPEQGDWRISVTFEKEVTTTSFEVKEYVLPKFDVTVTTPPFVLTNAEEVDITVCANYTYGKPVKGDLRMNISLETYSYYYEKTPVLEYEGEIDGCFNYMINISLIETDQHSYYRRIQITASVEESGTGIERNTTKLFDRQSSPLFLNFDRYERQFFKPGLPYNGKLMVTRPDNTPAEDECIQICYTVSKERVLSTWWATKKVKVCRNFTSDEEGRIPFIIPPQTTDSVGIVLEAQSLKYAKKATSPDRQNSLTQPETSVSLTPFYSPSGSFIQLQPVSGTLTSGTTRRFHLLFTSKESALYNFNFQVITPGGVAESGNLEVSFSTDDDVSDRFDDQNKLINGKPILLVPAIKPSKSPNPDEDCPSAREAKYIPPIGETYIELDIHATWSPSFRLLVFYVREDRETIADSNKFTVAPSFKNKVEFKFSDAVKQPATKTSIRVSASPNSICGIKVVDKSVSLLNANDQLTKEKVFQILASLDTGMYYGVNHCSEEIRQPGLSKGSSKKVVVPKRPNRPYSSSAYEDSLTAFENCGFVVISDLRLFTRPCKSNGGNNGPIYYSYSASRGGAIRPMAKSARRKSLPEMDMDSADMGVVATKSAVEVRNYFPETWLFNLLVIGEDGEFAMKETLPHTITEWVGSAVCINDEDGLGLSNQTTIRGFQAFFLSLTLPYSVVRGESFWVTVTVSSYVQEQLPITVSLEELTGFEVIGESINDDICVEPGENTNIKILLKAKTLGEQNITVKAETAESKSVCKGRKVSNALAKDGILNSLIVEAEGYPVEEVQSTLFCPSEEEGESFKKEYSLAVPEENYVNDSARSFLDITGNILGKSFDNLGNLLKLPSGCGEQNMAKFAPNVVAIKLLTSVNQLTKDLKNKIIKNLNIGAQNQMKYRRRDGSFSAFGDRDKEGSMFLTAFVLRYLYQAREFINIDNSTLTQMQTWIVSKQRGNGCFQDVGRIFDTGIKGGIKSDESLVTSYILASLYISGYQNQSVLDSALTCIEESQNESFYATFLFAYAEALAGKLDSAKERIIAARKLAVTKGGTEYYHDMNATKSQDLETDAYAILSILQSGGSASDVLPIVQYMSRNLNSQGGFLSTQDTCMGFEALAEFSKLTIKDPVDLTVTISGGGVKEKVSITEDKKLLVQRYKIPEVPADVVVKGVGTGCALIQSLVRYNTITPPGKRNFKITIASECLESECKRVSITICTSYIPEGGKTSMALVQAKMISGVVPVKESLDKLYGDPNLQLMRYDVENNIVVFYFLQITNEKKCFSFEVEVVILVENPQPGTVEVMDYYNNVSSIGNYTLRD